MAAPAPAVTRGRASFTLGMGQTCEHDWGDHPYSCKYGLRLFCFVPQSLALPPWCLRLPDLSHNPTWWNQMGSQESNMFTCREISHPEQLAQPPALVGLAVPLLNQEMLKNKHLSTALMTLQTSECDSCLNFTVLWDLSCGLFKGRRQRKHRAARTVIKDYWKQSSSGVRATRMTDAEVTTPLHSSTRQNKRSYEQKSVCGTEDVQQCTVINRSGQTDGLEDRGQVGGHGCVKRGWWNMNSLRFIIKAQHEYTTWNSNVTSVSAQRSKVIFCVQQLNQLVEKTKQNKKNFKSSTSCAIRYKLVFMLRKHAVVLYLYFQYKLKWRKCIYCGSGHSERHD